MNVSDAFVDDIVRKVGDSGSNAGIAESFGFDSPFHESIDHKFSATAELDGFV